MSFLPLDFKITDWSSLQPFYEKLTSRDIKSENDLRKLLLDMSELEGVISENIAWRYINMTRYTENSDFRESYEDFVKNIQPNISPYTDILNKIVNESEYKKNLKNDPDFIILLRCIEQNIQIYRKESIPILTDISILSQEYGRIVGEMMILHRGENITMQKAAAMLELPDRDKRENIYTKIGTRRLQDKDALNNIYTELIKKRHIVAQNAGFANYRDYMFVAMHRFDYSPQMCFDFHDAVEKEIVPLLNLIAQERKDILRLPYLKPWDKAVNLSGNAPLKPFDDEKDLTKKAISVLEKLNPYFGHCLQTMQDMDHLDLASRQGKAPGGYNYPLDVTGVPYIFMNASSTLGDMVTILHEAGHAVHSFLTKDLPLNDLKHCPSETAELASMSMELISMSQWHEFFADENDLRRAKKQHITDLLYTLSWVATIDCFQHWVYTNPDHSLEERKKKWNSIFDRFSDNVTDWYGCEIYKDYLWQKQLHLFEVPFYYIEYGIAQMGAIGIWRAYTEKGEKALEDYKEALKLGNTRSIPEVYRTAGIKFDFSKEYVSELAKFVYKTLKNI